MAQNQSQFGILEASVILSSTKNEDQVVDVRGNIIEVNFYENLYKPYVDASIVIIDDFGLRTALSTEGTERLKIVIGDASDPQEPIIVKRFFFSKINDVKRLNERAEALSIDLVQEHVYIDAVKQFSKSYNAPLEDIVTSIAEDELKLEIQRKFFAGSVQGERKIIVPYMSPLEAIQWIKDRATTETGSPIFLYGSLYTRNLILSDLDSLIKEEVINEKLPLRYTSAASSVSDVQEKLRPYYEIISFRQNNGDNLLSMYENGAIGSYYANLDAGTGVLSGEHVSIREIVDEFYAKNLISPDTVQSMFDPSLEIDGRLSDEYNSLHIHQVFSSSMYNQFQSYHDEATVFDRESNITESRLKVKNKIIRQILKKNVIDIGMSGSLYFEGKVTVGKKIRVLFLDPNVAADNKDPIKQIDQKKSGDYLILAINHKLIGEKHTSILRLTKLGELPKDIKL